MQPTRMAGPERPGVASAPSLFGFAPGGVCPAAPVTGRAVGSYPTFSPLPRRRCGPVPNQTAAMQAGRSFFCGTFPGVAPAGRYPAPYFRGARTFLTRDLSALARAAARPTDAALKGANISKRKRKPIEPPRSAATMSTVSRSASPAAEAPSRACGVFRQSLDRRCRRPCRA